MRNYQYTFLRKPILQIISTELYYVTYRIFLTVRYPESDCEDLSFDTFLLPELKSLAYIELDNYSNNKYSTNIKYLLSPYYNSLFSNL